MPYPDPMAEKPPVYSLLPVQAGLLKHLSSNLADLGLDLNGILEQEGYQSGSWLDEQKEVPAKVLETLLSRCLDDTGDELFGFHLGQRVKPEGFGVVGYIRQTCQNLQDFILICMRYEHLVSGLGKTQLGKEPGRYIWSWSASTLNPVFERHATEFMLAALNRTRSLIHSSNRAWLIEVRFTHSAPQALGARKEMEAYFGCRVRYNQAHNALVLDPDILNEPFIGADSSLMQSLERHAQSLEKPAVEKSFYHRAREKMTDLMIAQQASKQNLARGLGISSRHLHRQLAREKRNYRALQEEVRLALAIEYLSTDNRTVENIALALGYTESQSFIRWFKKQTGHPPSQYRKTYLARHPDNN